MTPFQFQLCESCQVSAMVMRETFNITPLFTGTEFTMNMQWKHKILSAWGSFDENFALESAFAGHSLLERREPWFGSCDLQLGKGMLTAPRG